VPYALRHSCASWSLAAGVNVFTLARRMGTSVKQIDKTCGHLVSGEDARESEMLDAWDAFARSTPVESDEAVI
jgi:integrase